MVEARKKVEKWERVAFVKVRRAGGAAVGSDKLLTKYVREQTLYCCKAEQMVMVFRS